MEEQKMNKDLEEILNKLIKFRDERDWRQFHTPENLAKSISIEANELLENYQWGSQNADLENIKEEVADIFGYLLLLCKELEIDLIDVANKKIVKNAKKYPKDKSFGNSKKYNKL
jgi:NTP pyrophosphatase (non-canonical NTP hydrolase)